MPVAVRCPRCLASYTVSSKYVGQGARCKCGELVLVGQVTETPTGMPLLPAAGEAALARVAQHTEIVTAPPGINWTRPLTDPALRANLGCQMHEYEVKLTQSELKVAGPNRGLCRLIGQRFLILINTPEGRELLASKPARFRLPDAFHIPRASSADKPEHGRLRFATKVGFDVPRDVTSDELSFLLGDYEQVHEYVYFVLRAISGRPASQLDIPAEAVMHFTVGLLKDAELTARIVAIQTMSSVTNEPAPTNGPVFHHAAKALREEWPVEITVAGKLEAS